MIILRNPYEGIWEKHRSRFHQNGMGAKLLHRSGEWITNTQSLFKMDSVKFHQKHCRGIIFLYPSWG